jgi:hypothetical protein
MRRPAAAKARAPFASDQETGVYFWVSGGEPDRQLSTHRHPLLPHRCAKHRWWSAEPCFVCQGAKAVSGQSARKGE